MSIKKYRALLPSLRFKTSVVNKELSKTKPLKSLTSTVRRTGGRNNQGREVVSSRGGGSKRKYRVIDFKRSKYGIAAKDANAYDILWAEILLLTKDSVGIIKEVFHG